MEKKIVSLTALFLRNTFNQMKFDSIEKTISSFEGNIYDELDETFEQIKVLLKKKAAPGAKKNATFLKKWERFKSEKWGYECLVCLKNIKGCLEKAQEGTIPEEYFGIVQKYYADEWSDKFENLKFRFSKSYVKSYKDYTEQTKLSVAKIDMLTDGFIVPFFKKNRVLYEDYIKWMRDTNNFFGIKERNKIITFQYTKQEYKSVQECVNAYYDFHEFNSKSFSDFLKELILILESISESRQDHEIVSDEKLEDIRKDIENLYQELFSYPEDTIGILKEEIDNMFWMAANDVIASYLFAKENRKLTWQECKKNSGFMAFMRYRLYSYLASKRENQFLSHYIKAIIKETKEKYGVYICEEAQIKNRVWIDENCKIGKCYIENDVVILSGVELMADDIVVKSGSVIGPDIRILNKTDKKPKLVN